jgi:hypothetical protein
MFWYCFSQEEHADQGLWYLAKRSKLLEDLQSLDCSLGFPSLLAVQRGKAVSTKGSQLLGQLDFLATDFKPV